MTPAPLFGVIGGTFWGNRGAEAMVSTTIAQIRRRCPNARVAVFSYYSAADRHLIADPAIEVLDCSPATLLFVHLPWSLVVGVAARLGVRWSDAVLPRGVRILRECHVLCDVQGISFDDGRLLFLPFKVLTMWPALQLGTPIVKLSQAMGPFENRLNRVVARWLLPQCDQCNARGFITAQYLTELGLPKARWRVASDVAFAFLAGDSLTEENVDQVETLLVELAAVAAQGRMTAAIAPSSLVMAKQSRLGRDYIEVLAQCAKNLLRRGLDVLVLPNATREGEKSLRNNDLEAVRRLRSVLSAALTESELSHVRFVEFDVNTDSVRRLLALSEVLIASRFHAMVAGLSLELPTLVLGWSHKYAEVLADFDLDGYAIDFAESDRRMLDMVDQLCDRRQELSAQIQERLPPVIASSLSQFEFLDRWASGGGD